MALKDLRKRKQEGQGNGETDGESQSDGANIKQTEERDVVPEKGVEPKTNDAVEEPLNESVSEKVSGEDYIDGDLVVGKEAEPVCCELEEAKAFEVSLENANIVEVREVVIDNSNVISVSCAQGINDSKEQDNKFSVSQDTEYGIDSADDKLVSEHTKETACIYTKFVQEKQDKVCNDIPEESNTSELPVEEIICPNCITDFSTEEVEQTRELRTEEIICPEHTEPSQETNTLPHLEAFEESFREEICESLKDNTIQKFASDSNCPKEDLSDEQLDVSGISVDITDSSKDSSGIKDTVDIEFEENSKTFVEKLKELKGNLLARHILREDSYSKIGSIDVDDKADIEFVRILSQPLGKTLDEELRESTGQFNESKYDSSEENSENKVADSSPGENISAESVKDAIYEQNSLEKGKDSIIEIKTSGIDRDTSNEHQTTEPNIKEHCKSDKDLNADEDDVVTKGFETDVDANVMLENRKDSNLKMPEPKEAEGLTVSEGRQEEEAERSVSPSMMFASCRYRWEKTIVTESESVVFVTINNKDVEPLKLEWQPSSGCFYSEEFKIPVGKYVGHLVVDGAFYPVEDITVKHYTFEVDLFLKDDIVEDESQKTGLEKAESFVKQQGNPNGLETVPNQGNTGNRYSPARANNYTYPPSRARMEAGQDKESASQNQADGSIHVTSKYEDLVRSQLNHTKTSILDDDVEPSHSIKSNYSDLDGRRSPVGDDGGKQYQDSDDTALKTADLGYGYRPDSASERERFNKSVVEDDVEQQSIRSGGSKASHSGQGSPGIIDDVLGNGHTRSPIYSTESPVHSRHSSAHSSAHNSAHSSARQTPTAAAPSPTRPESVGSNRSANSLSRNMLDDIINDSVRSDQRSPKPDANEDSRRGSGAVTPPSEQIGDVLNPADRHSPIRRDYFTDSPQLSHHSSQASAHNSLHASPHGSAHGSINGSTHGSQHGSAHGSAHGSQHGSNYGSQPGSTHSSQPGSAHSSQRQTPQLISDSFKASQERLYINDEKRSYSGSQASGSLPGSRPQSITSEQELSQYYENETDPTSPLNGVRQTPLSGDGGSVARTGSVGSAGSLPVIGSQRGTPDKRSMTPDNHIRVPPVGPIMKGPLLPNRTPTRTPVSNASSRTITPVNTPVNTPSDAIEQIRELETTASNLRVLLAAKEQEVFDLKGQLDEVKDTNRTLQGDLDRQRARASPGPQIAELERKYRDAVEERERLSSEVVKLREEIRLKDEPSLNRYNPNSPTALQRKIDELSSQVADLHEVNESAVEERSSLERRLKDLAAENETLRSTQSVRQQDIEEENRQLKAENKRLKESQSGYSDVTDYRYRIELQQVKEDNRSLRDRNYTLHDDNIRLKEELAELRKSVELMSNVRKQYKEEGVGSRKMDRFEKHEETETLVETYSSDLGRHDYKKVDPVPPATEERHRYSYKRSSRYDTKPDMAVKVEKEYETERFSKSDGARYVESYRIAGDGGSCDKPTRASSKYDPRPLTPERPSALGPARKDYGISESLEKKYDLYERRDEGRGRRDRNRTSSADLDFRSMPLSTYNDLAKTTPALSGRSREIYQELSDKRAAIKTKDNAQHCESEEKKPELELETDQTQNPSNSNSLSSKVFVNRYYPQNKESEEKQPDTDEMKRLSADRMDLAYAKSSPLLLSRPQKEEKAAYDPRPAEAFLDDGDMSDTPTDILVSTQPLERLPPSSTWARSRNRRGSVGSDASNSSFSDIDEQISASVRKRSKSADGREILRRSMQTNSLRASSAKGEKSLSRTLSPAPPHSGHRTVTPRPLATQHNKSSLNLSSSIGSLTHGLRPFAPRSAGDLQIGDVIKFSRQGGKLSQGTIRFIGHLPGRGDIYLGVELDKEDGKHDGVFEGIRYFKCKPSKGVFVAYNKVVMAWTV